MKENRGFFKWAFVLYYVGFKEVCSGASMYSCNMREKHHTQKGNADTLLRQAPFVLEIPAILSQCYATGTAGTDTPPTAVLPVPFLLENSTSPLHSLAFFFIPIPTLWALWISLLNQFTLLRDRWKTWQIFFFTPRLSEMLLIFLINFFFMIIFYYLVTLNLKATFLVIWFLSFSFLLYVPFKHPNHFTVGISREMAFWSKLWLF